MKESYREDLKRLGYQADEIKQIEKFLALMCEPAHGYVINIFVRCRREKAFSMIMLACRFAWSAVWKNGTPDRLGDVDDVTSIGEPDSRHPVASWGAKNWKAFTGVYEALGLGCPKTL